MTGITPLALSSLIRPEGSADDVRFVGRSDWLAAAAGAYQEGFHYLSDLCAVDYLGNHTRRLPGEVEAERFEVVANLVDLRERRRLRLRAQVPEDKPEISTLFPVYPGCEAMEREAFDLFGIVFTGHPDMTRILLPEDWEGHPLRKDYEVGRVPVQFKPISVDGRLEP
jgi:NADH-quinone oxidoreductase subunit C